MNHSVNGKATSLVLLVQIDALRHDYINDQDSPFLAEFGRQGIQRILRPTFGFEPDGAYLAGRYPDECDGGAHFWRRPEESPYRGISRVASLLNLFPSKLIRDIGFRGINRCLRTLFGRTLPAIENIPFDIIGEFAPVWEPSPFASGFHGYPTLFSICREFGIPQLAHAHPEYSVRLESGMTRLLKELRPPIRFAFWHIGDLDSMGHKYGPLSPERKERLRRIDNCLSKLRRKLDLAYERVHYIFFGDHGMTEVTGSIDVAGVLRQAGITQGNGVRYFLDSTMARFWVDDPRQRHTIVKTLNSLDGGSVLTDAQKQHYHLNYSHNRFGDVIFLADPGRLIFPNYFQGDKPIRGMHGYAPESTDQKSALITNASVCALPNPVDMTAIFPLVTELLGVSLPSTVRTMNVNG